jgi:hypothetical protein
MARNPERPYRPVGNLKELGNQVAGFAVDRFGSVAGGAALANAVNAETIPQKAFFGTLGLSLIGLDAVNYKLNQKQEREKTEEHRAMVKRFWESVQKEMEDSDVERRLHVFDHHSRIEPVSAGDGKYPDAGSFRFLGAEDQRRSVNLANEAGLAVWFHPLVQRNEIRGTSTVQIDSHSEVTFIAYPSTRKGDTHYRLEYINYKAQEDGDIGYQTIIWTGDAIATLQKTVEGDDERTTRALTIDELEALQQSILSNLPPREGQE